MENIRDSSFGKMSPPVSQAAAEKISASSLKKSAKSREKYLYLGLTENGQDRGKLWILISPSPGGRSMRSIGVSPKDAPVSTLSQILLDKVPEKYYLSAKACQGILRRAASRGKVLPEILKIALERQIEALSA